MSLLGLFKGFPKRLSNLMTPDWIAAAGGYPVNTGNGVDTLPSPSQSVGLGAIYQSISLLSDPLCSQPMQVRQTNPEGGTHIVMGSDTARALAAWRLTDKEKFLFDCLVSGNGFAAVRRNGRGGVVHLETISANRVTVAVDDNSTVWYELSENAELNQKAETIPAKDMVHLRYRCHANNTIVGQSPLITLAPSIGGVKVVEDGRRYLFTNLALPSIILSSPNEIGGDVLRRIRDSFQAGASGSKQGRMAILDNDFRPYQIERAKALDYQVAELDSINTKALSRVYSIPPAMLGESGSTAYNSSVELIRSFHSLTLRPLAKRVGDCLGQVLLDDEQRAAGMFISISMDSLIRGEGKELADYLSVLTNSGILAVNESRQLVGLEDMPGGDMLRSPVNVMPIDNWQDYNPGSTKDQPAPTAEDQKQWRTYAQVKFKRAILK